MATARTIIDGALKEIGALGVGQAQDSADFDDALTRLNQMLDEWNTERLNIYQITAASYTLVVDQSDYTIGASATSPDFTATRPIEIENANILNTGVTPNQRTPVAILTKDDWAERYTVESYEYPYGLYYEPAFPKATIHLFQSPTVAHKLELFTRQQFAAFSSLSATVTLPPGYESALLYNLAVRLAPSYERPVHSMTGQMAAVTRAKIKSVNAPVPFLDATGYTQPGVDIYGGGYTWR